MKTIYYDPNGGRSYSPSGGTFYTPRGDFGVVGSDGKTHFPAPSKPKPALPKRSPSENMSQRYGDNTFRGTRAPVLNMRPDGTYNIMPTRQGHSLPGYPGTQKYNPRGVNNIARAAARLGLLGTKLHPITRTISLGFDVVNALHPDNDWAYGPKTEPDPAEVPAIPTGWRIDCFNSELPWDIGYGTVGDLSTQGGCPGGNCSPGYTNPNTKSAMDEIALTRPHDYETCGKCGPGVRLQVKMSASIGPGNAATGTPLGRYAQKIKICADWPLKPECRDVPICETVYWRIPQGVRTARPVPFSAPPPPVMQEVTTSPRLPRTRCRPYSRPMVEASYGGRRSPPSNGCHTLTSRGKERKVLVRGKLGLAAIAKLYDATTEAKEIVDILYDNLGKKCPGAKSMSAKANCVYRNIGTLNVANAALELAKNHYEDKVYGRIYGTVGKNTDFGSMLPGTGPSRSVGSVRKL